MADFIVLEEDGTSHLLTESSDSLLLEESSPQSRSASFSAAAFIDIAPAPPPPSYATWQAGSITVPGSPGSVAVTGLGGTPCAVWFLGTNFSTEDSVVTTTGTGISRGSAAHKWDDPGTIHNHAAFVSPAGDQSRITFGCINSLTTAGNASAVDVVANLSSFDADGFTVGFSTVTSGRKLAWFALMNVQNCGAYIGGNTTLGLGWKAGSSLVQAGYSSADSTLNNQSGIGYGGAAYPGSTSSGWWAAGLAAVAFPANSNQYAPFINYIDPPTTRVTRTGHFTGPSLTLDNVTAYPSGGGLTNFTLGFGPANGGGVVMWDDEDSQTGTVTPAQNTTDTTTVSGLPFAPGLVVFYSISDEPPGQTAGTPVRGAVMLSFATTAFQWAAVIDPNDRGSYQSFNRGFADTVHNTDLHAGTVELTNDGFILTTEEDSATTHAMVWQAFGHPDQLVMWLPHIYRRVFG